MPVAAWAIPAAIGAGVSIWGTQKQASAAKDAANQQVQSATQARADLEPIYRENVARLNPYASLGSSAVGSLNSLMGYSPTPQTGYNASGAPLGPLTGTQGPMNTSDPRVQQLARGGSLADLSSGGRGFSGSPTGTAVPRTASSYGSLSSLGMGPKMVRLMAPTGEIGEFPESQAAQFEQAGARRV